MVKVIIRDGIVQDVLSTEPVEIEIVDVNYPRLKSRASLARRDNDLKYCP